RRSRRAPPPRRQPKTTTASSATSQRARRRAIERDGFIDAHDVTRHIRPVVTTNALGTEPAKVVALRGIVEQRPRSGCERLDVAVAEERTRAAVVENGAKRLQVAGKHRGACGHGLEQHNAETLAAGIRRDV